MVITEFEGYGNNDLEHSLCTVDMGEVLYLHGNEVPNSPFLCFLLEDEKDVQ